MSLRSWTPRRPGGPPVQVAHLLSGRCPDPGGTPVRLVRLRRLEPPGRRPDRRGAGAAVDHVDLEGDPDAEPPVPPHVDVWRSYVPTGTPRRGSPGARWGCPDGVEALAEQLQRQAAVRQRAGTLWQDNGLVFTTAHGTQLDAADVRRSLRTICRKAGIAEEWTPRELRHTFVSLLSDNGMAIEEISRLVGHSSSNVTETVYRHQIRPVITVGAEAMDKIFANEQ